MQSHSEILGVKTSTGEFAGGHNQPITAYLGKKI